MPVVIAPWLKPTDVIGSASAGANLGLAARARDLQEAAQQQAAEEFIAKLNQQAQQFSQHLASQHEIAASRLAQALRAQDALDVYRKGELDVRNKEAETHAARLLKENSFEPKEITTPGGTKLMQTGPNRYQILPEPFKGEEVDIGGEKYIRTSPQHLQKKTTSKDLTPSQWSSYINNIQKQLESAASDEEKATLGLQLKTAQDKQRELMTPGLPKAVITPGTNYLLHPDIPPKTNWVQSLQGTNAPAAAIATAPKEVRRMVGNRVAIFDADTKQFLRYAE